MLLLLVITYIKKLQVVLISMKNNILNCKSKIMNNLKFIE